MCSGTIQKNKCPNCSAEKETIVWFDCELLLESPEGSCRDTICPEFQTADHCQTCEDEFYRVVEEDIQQPPPHPGFPLPTNNLQAVVNLNPTNIRYEPIQYQTPVGIENLPGPDNELPSYTEAASDPSPPTFDEMLNYAHFECIDTPFYTSDQLMKARGNLNPIRAMLRKQRLNLRPYRHNIPEELTLVNPLARHIYSIEMSIKEVVNGYLARHRRARHLALQYHHSHDGPTPNHPHTVHRAAIRRELLDTFNQSTICSEDCPHSWKRKFEIFPEFFAPQLQACQIKIFVNVEQLGNPGTLQLIRQGLRPVTPVVSNNVECILDGQGNFVRQLRLS